MGHVMIPERSNEVHELQALEETKVDLSLACKLDGPYWSRFQHMSLL
jgi:hypothetical protein